MTRRGSGSPSGSRVWRWTWRLPSWHSDIGEVILAGVRRQRTPRGRLGDRGDGPSPIPVRGDLGLMPSAWSVHGPEIRQDRVGLANVVPGGEAVMSGRSTLWGSPDDFPEPSDVPEFPMLEPRHGIVLPIP